MEPGLMDAGLQLMLAGMGTVFVFLTILVGATSLMSRLVARYLPTPELAAAEVRPESGDMKEEVAAISAAIAMHRSRRR